MATKRRIPKAVQEQLERKRKLTSTLAVRQGAALGKDARQRLRPLTEAPQETRSEPQSISGYFQAAHDAMLAQIQQMYTTPSFPSYSSIFFPSRIIEVGSKPSIDSNLLNSLKTAEPYKPAPRVPDRLEVITGWRGWALSKSGKLEALGRDTVWPTKQALEAECTGSAFSVSGRHFAPYWDCNCGIWAFKDLDRLVAAIGSSYQSIKVLGTVSLWGRVIETENGYRAQYAYPSELWLLDSSLEELGRIYDVPIRRVS